MSKQAIAELIQPLTADEQHQLGELLGAIREVIFNSGMTIGYYLSEIKSKKLYRDYPGDTDAERWAAFVSDKLPIKVKRTYQLIRAYQVLSVLQQAGIEPLPTREKHIRPLCPLLKDKQAGNGLIITMARNVIAKGGWTEDVVKQLASTKPKRISTKVENPDDDDAELEEKHERKESAPLRLLNPTESIEVGNDNPHDVYCTPEYAIKDICEFETWEGVILDPAANDGRIMRQAIKLDGVSKFISRDIRTDDIGEGVEGGVDFLTTTEQVDGIICNPPYTVLKERQLGEEPMPRADLFVKHAKTIARSKFTMLVPLGFLGGCNRFNNGLLHDPKYPIKAVYIYVARLQFGNAPKSSLPTCWIVWEKGFKGHPVIRWINNQDQKS